MNVKNSIFYYIMAMHIKIMENYSPKLNGCERGKINWNYICRIKICHNFDVILNLIKFNDLIYSGLVGI